MDGVVFCQVQSFSDVHGGLKLTPMALAVIKGEANHAEA